MKYYIKKYQTPPGPIENTYWSNVKIEGITPLKIEKVDTGQTKKVKVGTKQLYKQVDGSWSDDFNENSVVSTVNSRGQHFYKRAGENYIHRGNYGSVWRTVDVYEDQPVYRGRYLYRNEDEPKPKPKTITSKPTHKVNTKVPIPDKYKEGLVKIEDGLTFYEFPEYTSEQVLAAISGLYGNSIPEQIQMYEDYLKPKTEESDLPTNSNTDDTSSLLQTLEQTSNNINKSNGFTESTESTESNDSIFSRAVNKVKNLISDSVKSFTNKLNSTEIETKPLGKRSYAYPHKETFLYAIDPEVSLEVLTKLQELGKGNLNENLKKLYLLAKKPLTNQQPGTTINDTIYTFVNNSGILYETLPRLNMDSKDTLSYTGYFIDPNEIINNTANISELTYDNAWEPLPHYNNWNKDLAKLTRKNDFLKYVNVINKKEPFDKELAEKDNYRWEDFTFLEGSIPQKHQDFQEKLSKEKDKRLLIISKRQSK